MFVVLDNFPESHSAEDAGIGLEGKEWDAAWSLSLYWPVELFLSLMKQMEFSASFWYRGSQLYLTWGGFFFLIIIKDSC